MIKLRQNKDKSNSSDSTTTPNGGKRISIRDKLLVKEVAELESNLPHTCAISFPDSNKLHTFHLTVTPSEGHYTGGHFRFNVHVPEQYNIMPPEVKCLTKLWHPNISEDGDICLSLLRPTSIDGYGWSPTRDLKDVVWGINSLFVELLNFDDPLNIEAAEHFKRDKSAFKKKVEEYMRMHALR